MKSGFSSVSLALVACAVFVGGCTPNVSQGQSPYPAIPTSGRYSSAIYSDAQLTVASNVEYTTAVDVTGSTIPLHMDVYVPPLPAGATALPTVVIVHGGGFIAGTRADMTSTAKSYARRGFVAANIDYRIDPDALTSIDRWIAAAQMAIDDGMEASRWLKANATADKIDTTRMAFVGSSAGGGVALGVGAANDPTPGGPLAAYSPSVAAVVSTGATLSPGIDLGLVTFEATDAPALMFHYDKDSVTTFAADYSRRTCDLLVLAGSRCRWVQQSGTGHTVSMTAGGTWWTPEIGPFLWAELRLATAPA